MLTEFDLLAQTLWLSGFAVAMVFVLLISWRYPRQIFWAVFFFRPLLEMSRLMKGNNELVQGIINGVGIVVPAVLLLVLFFHKKIWSEVNLLPMAFLVVMLFTGSLHEMNFEAGEMLIRILTPVVFLVYPQMIIQSEKDLKTFLRVVAVSTIFVLLAVYLDRQRTNVHPVYGWVQDAIPLKSGETQNRLGAIFGVPTMTAYWAFQFFAVTYFLFETERTAVRFFWMGIWIILLIPIYFAFSRATWLGCLITLFLYSVLKGRLARTTAWILSIAAVTIVVLPNIVFRLQNPLTIGYRFAVWSGYLRSLVARGVPSWLAGMGFANLPGKNIYSGYLYEYGASGFVENSFIFLLAGAGLVALIVFIFMILNLVRRASWLRKNGTTPLIRDFGAWSICLLVVWLVMGMVGDMVSYVVINWYWYAYFGCILALWKNRKESAQTREGISLVLDPGE
jgi:hypothetical protein